MKCKEYEVLRITYRWDKYTRKLINEPKWLHHRYYKALSSALDAIRDFRNSWYDKIYYDYPALADGVENEKEYPSIKPVITIHRYRAGHIKTDTKMTIENAIKNIDALDWRLRMLIKSECDNLVPDEEKIKRLKEESIALDVAMVFLKTLGSNKEIMESLKDKYWMSGLECFKK